MAANEYVKSIIAIKCLKQISDMNKMKKKRKHRFWVNPFLEIRTLHDLEAHLLKDILWEDGSDLRNFCRMSIHQFDEILEVITPQIEKLHTLMRFAVTSRVRLAIILRFLATGDSYRSLEFLSYVSRKTISKFVPEVLSAIVNAFEEQYIKTPSSATDWLQIAKDFESLWQFPHTLGSVDGKHIRIKAPPNSGSDFYNYIGFFTVVLLAVVDAYSRFIYIDVGGNGRASDVVVWKNSSLYRALTTGALNLPSSSCLAGQEVVTPYFFISDDIFGLDSNFLKAYNRSMSLNTSQEVFNYRLSRARLTVETAFGKLAARFRVFHRPIELSLETCDVLVKACCILHNYLSRNVPHDIESEPMTLPKTFTPLSIQEYNRYKYANSVRENVCKYCVTNGDVEFQWRKIKKQIIR